MFDADHLELIDRQFKWVLELDGAAFIRQAQRCLNTLGQDPRVAALFADMMREADQMVADLWSYDDRASAEVIRLRKEFVRLFPLKDDSTAKEPGPNEHDASWPTTFAYFDKIALSHTRERPSTYEYQDETLTKRLIEILYSKMQHAGPSEAPRGEIDAFRKPLNELRERHSRIHARFVDDKLTSGPVALVALRNFLFAALDPIGLSLDPDWNSGNPVSRFSPVVPGGTPSYDLLKRNHTSDEVKELAANVSAHRPRLRTLYEDLRARVGTRASLLALLDRFQHRCQWHDRMRLWQLAEGARARAEGVLCAELARWYFDQGMSPLSEAMMAGLRPDLTDPTSPFNLYVEAKQYKKAARPYLVKGFHQLWDTVSGMKGTPYAVHEAFYVVFRRGGPRYVLPERIQGEGWIVHLRLIDIAPNRERGSRGASKPEIITAEELQPKRVPRDEKSSTAPGPSRKRPKRKAG